MKLILCAPPSCRVPTIAVLRLQVLLYLNWRFAIVMTIDILNLMETRPLNSGLD